jgi:hypothetical protein
MFSYGIRWLLVHAVLFAALWVGAYFVAFDQSAQSATISAVGTMTFGVIGELLATLRQRKHREK